MLHSKDIILQAAAVCVVQLYSLVGDLRCSGTDAVSSALP